MHGCAGEAAPRTKASPRPGTSLAEEAVEDWHSQVQLDQHRPARKRAFRRVRQEARPDLDDPEACDLERLDHGTVAERQLVVEEIPVHAVGEADVRLKHEDASAWPEYSMPLA